MHVHRNEHINSIIHITEKYGNFNTNELHTYTCVFITSATDTANTNS